MAARPKLRRRRRTKIIATLGPASSTPEILARLFQAGADVFRLNFSHGTHEDHAARVAMIRESGGDDSTGPLAFWPTFRVRNCALAVSPAGGRICRPGGRFGWI